MIEILLKGSKEAQNWGELPWRELKSLNTVLNSITHPQFMVLVKRPPLAFSVAETSVAKMSMVETSKAEMSVAEMSKHRKTSTLMTKQAQTVNHGSTITVDKHGRNITLPDAFIT